MSALRRFGLRTAVAAGCVATIVVAALLQTGGSSSTAVLRWTSARLPNGGGSITASAGPSTLKVGQPFVAYVAPAVTPPLRDLPVPSGPGRGSSERPEPAESPLETTAASDPVVQTVPSSTLTPAVLASFEGLTNRDNFRYSLSQNSSRPPDNTGDVGPNHYVEWINTVIQVYDKTGTPLLTTPKSGEQLFQSLNQPPDPAHTDVCAAGNAGDPIVLYDQLAQRWVLSQFGFTVDPSGMDNVLPPFHQCVAVSRTPDPTGEYCAYSFPISLISFNDYPKMAMRPEGYYTSYNMFAAALVSPGGGVSWMDRAAMLNCTTAAEVVLAPENFPALALKTNLLPADTDGPTMPPANEPEFFIRRASATTLELFKFKVDLANPASSTFSPAVTITVPSNATAGTVPQKDTTNRLDALSDRLMFRLAYRNWGTSPPPGIPANTESLVVDHSVVAGAFSAIRWYEIRNPNGTPTLYQSGTYSPDSHHRWMGSVAQDKLGDLMVGYSVSGTDMYPSIRLAGRLQGDLLGQLGTESSMIEGGGPAPVATGSVTADPRWGDYTHISVDPVDDCTFWYINEYYLNTDLIPEDTVATKTRWWRTRIGHLAFPECTGTPTAVAVRSFTSRWSGKHVAVTWRTASETGVLGFNVFRSVGAGPFRKLNTSLITAKRVGSAAGAAYRLVDRAVKRSKTYTYRLQLVSSNGKRSWYGVGSAATR